jgi:hypothetical protein
MALCAISSNIAAAEPVPDHNVALAHFDEKLASILVISGMGTKDGVFGCKISVDMAQVAFAGARRIGEVPEFKDMTLADVSGAWMTGQLTEIVKLASTKNCEQWKASAIELGLAGKSVPAIAAPVAPEDDLPTNPKFKHSERTWLAFPTTSVGNRSDFMPDVELTRRLSRGRQVYDLIFFSGKSTLTNAFGRKTDALTAIYLLKGSDGNPVAVDVAISEADFDDQRLLAKLYERECDDDDSIPAKYSHLVAEQVIGQIRFDDADIQAGKIDQPQCAFWVKGSLFKGSNFFGIRHVTEAKRK